MSIFYNGITEIDNTNRRPGVNKPPILAFLQLCGILDVTTAVLIINLQIQSMQRWSKRAYVSITLVSVIPCAAVREVIKVDQQAEFLVGIMLDMKIGSRTRSECDNVG